MKYSDYNDYELLNYISDGNEEANNIIIKSVRDKSRNKWEVYFTRI